MNISLIGWARDAAFAGRRVEVVSLRGRYLSRACRCFPGVQARQSSAKARWSGRRGDGRGRSVLRISSPTFAAAPSP